MAIPFVSVIVPARNEQATIARCLDSLMAQDYPRDEFEVIVVDGASEDDTVSIAGKYPVTVLNNPQRTAPYAMNLGLAAARGEIIFRLDAHAWAAPDYLSKGVALLSSEPAACVGGPIESLGEGTWGEAISAAMSCPFGVGNAAFRYSREPRWVDTVAFGAYWRWVFERIGVFDPELTRNQDDELNYRLTNSGLKILLSPEMHTYYVVRSSLKALWSQYYQYGFWKVRVLRKHRRPTTLRQLVPPTFVLAEGVGLLAGLALGIWVPWYGLNLVYFLTALVVGQLVGQAKKRRLEPLYGLRVTVAFGVMHFAYGSGFLAGLFAPRAGRRRTINA